MDGRFHAVEFDPSATAQEVLKLVKAKIGLRDSAEGYAVYEVLGQQERSLLNDEKVADVMSKWEKYRTAGGTLSRFELNQNQNAFIKVFLSGNLVITCSYSRNIFSWMNISIFLIL